MTQAFYIYIIKQDRFLVEPTIQHYIEWRVSFLDWMREVSPESFVGRLDRSV